MPDTRTGSCTNHRVLGAICIDWSRGKGSESDCVIIDGIYSSHGGITWYLPDRDYTEFESYIADNMKPEEWTDDLWNEDDI